MKKVTTNKNQIEMDKIANDMAVLFEKKISASQLAYWIAIINDNEDNPSEIRNLIWEFGFTLLPNFIKCGTKDERINFLKENLPELFSTTGSDMVLRESLGAIGIKYFTDFKTLRSDANFVGEFMQNYVTLLCLCEMYDHYVFYENELEKEKAA